MYSLAVLAIFSFSGVLGKSSVSGGDGGVSEIISQNLTAVWEAITDLEHKVHHLQDHPQDQGHGHGGGHGRTQLYGGHGDPDHPHHGGHGDHQSHGGSRGGSHKEGSHHELMSLLHEVGIQHTASYYMSSVINSTTQVKPEGGSKLQPAFGAAYFLYLKGHFTGSHFSNYAHDMICTYNAGGSVAFHLIHPDGRHERLVLGDVQKDHHAQYVVIVPGGVWSATELVEGDFNLMTFVVAPAMDYTLFKAYDVEELVGEFSQYEDMIRRLHTIDANDVPVNLTQSSHDHQGHQGHDHHDQNHDEHHDDHGSRHSHQGYGFQQRSHQDYHNDHHDDHHGNHGHSATHGNHHDHHQHGVIGNHDESHGHNHHDDHGHGHP